MSLTPDDRKRRRAAKLFNERLKLAARLLNAASIGVFAAALIVPGVSDSTLRPKAWIWILLAIALHISAQAILGFYRGED